MPFYLMLMKVKELLKVSNSQNYIILFLNTLNKTISNR